MIINDIDIDTFKVKVWEIVILIINFLIPVFFLVLSYKINDASWFARSGSLMVVIGAFLEYRNFNNQQYLREGRDATWKPREEYVGALKIRKVFDICLLVSLALGTVIWGYGDLVF